MARSRSSGTVGAGETMLGVIEFLDDRDGARLSDIASELDVATSTAHRHVKTLEQQGYVVTDGGQIKLSTAFLRLGNAVRYRTEIAEVAESVVKGLAETTGERANFFTEENERSVCLHRKLGEQGVIADTKIGKQFPLHATAAGKAILSQFPEPRVRSYVQSHGLPALTDGTITDEATLLDELRTIRAENVAYNDEEYIENLRSVGVPITKGSGPVSAITVSGPTHRLSDDRINDELTEVVLGAANELELKIEYE